MDINELARKYGTDVGVDTPTVSTHFSNVINKYGSGAIKAVPPAIEQPELDYIPKPGRPTTGQVSVDSPLMRDIKASPEFLRRETIKQFKAGRSLAGQGIQDITSGMSATGIGEVGLGGLQMAGALPIAAIEGGKKIIERSTGNKEFAERATAVATSGLPIAKIGKVAAATMPSNRALSDIIELVGKENLATVIAELKSNPRLTLADVAPSVQSATMGLAARPGEPRNKIVKFIESRKGDQKGTIIEAFDEAMGVPPSIKAKTEELKKSIRGVGKEINPILEKSNVVDVTPVIANIDAKLKPGVQSVISVGEPLPGPRVKEELAEVRKFLSDDKQQRTDAKELHTIQSALRARAEALLNSASGEERQVGYALMNVRNQIVDAIDRVSPQITDASGKQIGTYRAQLSKYREANDIDDAFQKGMLVTRNKLGRLEDHPEFWAEWVKSASPAELEAARQGARLAVAHQMGAFRFSARKGMEVPEAEFNAEKLKLLFGEKEVNQLMKALQDERKINDTDQKLLQNSMTAMRLLGAEKTKIREDYKPNMSALIAPAAETLAMYLSGGSSMGMGAASVIGYQAARRGVTKAGQKLDRATNIEITDLATATGESKEALIKALQDALPKAKLSSVQKLKLALPGKP